MSYTLSANVTTTITASHTQSTGNVTYSGSPQVAVTKALSSSDITKVYYGSRTTTGETLDVTSGLTDPYGASLNFATVKGLIVKNTHATSSLTVGGGSNALFNALPVITAGGSICLNLSITTSGSVKNIVAT